MCRNDLDKTFVFVFPLLIRHSTGTRSKRKLVLAATLTNTRSGIVTHFATLATLDLLGLRFNFLWFASCQHRTRSPVMSATEAVATNPTLRSPTLSFNNWSLRSLFVGLAWASRLALGGSSRQPQFNWLGAVAA